MRGTLHKVYGASLRVQGGYTLGLIAMSLAGAPLSAAQGYYVSVPVMNDLLALPLVAMFVAPVLTPGWLRDPRGWAGAAALIVHTIAPFLFLLPAYSAVLHWGVAEPIARALSMALAGSNMLLSLALWWMALGLSLMKPPAPRPASPPRDPAPSPADLRELHRLRGALRG